jgi:hypothetical protein
MLAQRLFTLMDDLAGIRVPHHFLVTILAPIFDLKPFHPIVVPSRPTRLRKQRQPRLPPGLLRHRTYGPVSHSLDKQYALQQGYRRARRVAFHTVCCTVTTPILQIAAPKTPLSALLLAPLRVGPPSRAPSPVAHVGYCRPSR